MRNYTAPSSRLLLVAALGASSCSLLGCALFEPETHWECFNPDCSAVDSGISGGGAGGRDAGGDAGASGGSGSGSGGGGASGSGGSAGSACMECGADQVCDEVSGECVQCLGNGDCEPPTRVCTVDHRCVACTLDRHCPSAAPACNDDNTCVGCTNSALHCGGDTPLCDVARHECVQCLGNSDCTDPAASRCSDGMCLPCTGPLHCDHLDGLGVCDTSSGTGECVQCTGNQYASCGMSPGGDPYVCNSLTRTCSTEEVASAAACETCVSDAQCATGMACMQTKFGAADAGNYCLWNQEATGSSAPNGDCLTVRPYVGTESGWTSVDGESPTVCKPSVTTCQGQNDFRSKSCSGETVAGHAECGAEGVDDGYCAPFGPSQHFCTVPCVSHLDCKDTRPGDDMECQSQTLGAQMLNVCQFE
jgi:hypothetical protein